MKSAVLLASSLLLLPAATAAQTGPAQVYKPGNGVQVPRVVSDVKPSYTANALRERIQGLVRLECVVAVDGTVGDVTVISPLDPELDAEAIAALKQWRFLPGTKDGQPVPVAVEVEMTFSLARRGPPLGSPDVYLISTRGVTPPKVTYSEQPEYPPAARTAAVQGVVGLDVVVLPDGTVGDVRVSSPLDPGLDAAAIRAVNRWRFESGTYGGRAVPTQVAIEMSFSLK